LLDGVVERFGSQRSQLGAVRGDPGIDTDDRCIQRWVAKDIECEQLRSLLIADP